MKAAEEVRIKILRLQILLSKVLDYGFYDFVDEEFTQRWNKRIQQYQRNLIESYTKEKSVRFVRSFDQLEFRGDDEEWYYMPDTDEIEDYFDQWIKRI